MRNLWIALLAFACAPATVDLVQPNAVSKTTFAGEWYTLDTVVDVPYGTGITFEGAQGDLSRITWKIEEKVLYGYRSYANVANAEPTDGNAPIVAYAIQKHFDIRRSYDPRTGEETNVIEENTERPWYEREHMRVDWSTNLAAGGRLSLAGSTVAVTAWTDTAPTSEWLPTFDDSDGDGVIDHISLFARVIAAPEETVIDGYGAVPTCYFYGRQTTECAPQEIVLHSHFARVDPAHAYIGEAWPDTWMDTFGFFSTERLHYDRRYGVTETEHVRWAHRHDLWKESLRRDAAGRALCKVRQQEVLCEEAKLEDDPRPSLIPYREREVRPLVYHVGPDFDPSLKPALARLEAEWSAPFRDTVNQLRFWECLDDGGKAAKCAEVIDPDLQMFVLCPNNPSLPGDPDLCSTDHTGPDRRPDGVPDLARPGDLRYRFLNNVDVPQNASPLGYGPSAADPVGTVLQLADGELELGAGELISANANIYNAPLDRISQTMTDLVKLVEGDLPQDEYIDGENVAAWVNSLRDKRAGAGLAGTFEPPTPGVQGPLAPLAPLRQAGAGAVLDTMDGAWTAPAWAGLDPRPTDPFALRRWLKRADEQLAASGVVHRAGLQGRLAWDRLRSTDLDDPLWNDEGVAALGLDPAQVDSALLAARSPLDAFAPDQVERLEEGLKAAGAHALDLEAGSYANPTLLGLARRYRDQGMSYAEIFEAIRQELYVAVSLHELGHTVGLRHNFAGTVDAWNYGPDYWALRDDGDMGPRHVDPETDAEVNGQIREHQYSTIMDYPANYNGDWHGLGHYDHAAIKMGYGELVEVMDKPSSTPVVPGATNGLVVAYVASYASSTLFPGPLIGTPDGGIAPLHYTDYPRVAELESRVDVPWRHLTSRSPTEGVPVQGFGSQLEVDETVDGVVGQGLPAAPYRFCSDEFAGNTLCNRWDEGADPYEILHNYMGDYWDRYFLDNFARDRYGFGFGDYAGTRYARTFRPIETAMRSYALVHTVFGAEFDPKIRAWLADDRGLGGWTTAAADSFRFLTQVIARPEPGALGMETRADGTDRLVPGQGGQGAVDLPLGTGAWYSSTWDFDGGYHWYTRWRRIGTYWDRMVALQALTAISPYAFVGYDTASDPRTYALGFGSLWQPQINQFLGSLLADDVPSYAPVHLGEGALLFRDPLSDAAWPPADTRLVEPGSYWLVRYAAGLYASTFLQEGFAFDWLDGARIYAEGSDEALTPPPGVDVATFVDPDSGVTWSAWRRPKDGVEAGPGARLLDHANLLLTRCASDDAITLSEAELACAELRRVADDIALQSRIVATLGDGVVRQE